MSKKKNCVVLFGERVSASYGTIPKYRRDETDEVEISRPRRKDSHPRDRHERWIRDQHHNSERSKKNASKWRRPENLERGELRDNKATDKFRSEVKDLVFAFSPDEQEWLVLVDNYWHLDEIHFFGTLKEVVKYATGLYTHHRGWVNIINPRTKVNFWDCEEGFWDDPFKAQAQEDYPSCDQYAWVDYSLEEERSDFGKVLSSPIGNVFTPIAWEVKRK